MNKKFKNCNEEQIFDAVMCYCKSKSDSGATFDNLVPGLYKSCGAYLKYIQSVPRTLTLKSPRKGNNISLIIIVKTRFKVYYVC